MTDKHTAVLQLIFRCKGRQRAISAKQLSRLTGLSDREVRAVVADLRREEYPIASAVNKPYGFFIPETLDEARECQSHIYARMREIGITARALDRAFGEHIPGKQMVLSLFDGGESA